MGISTQDGVDCVDNSNMNTLVVPRSARQVLGSIRKFRPHQFRSITRKSALVSPVAEKVIDITDPSIADETQWMDIEAEDQEFDEKLDAFMQIDDADDQAERKWLMSGR